MPSAISENDNSAPDIQNTTRPRWRAFTVVSAVRSRGGGKRSPAYSASG
jgi:hypothetical protein